MTEHSNENRRLGLLRLDAFSAEKGSSRKNLLACTDGLESYLGWPDGRGTRLPDVCSDNVLYSETTILH